MCNNLYTKKDIENFKEKALPCKRCGSKPQIYMSMEGPIPLFDERVRFYAECPECEWTESYTTGLCYSINGALKSWNKRFGRKEQVNEQ